MLRTKLDLETINDDFQDYLYSDREEYIKFLDTMARFHKYDVPQQMTMHIFAPKATAMATADFWGKYLGRTISPTAQNLEIIDEKSPSGVKIVYDIADTVGDTPVPDVLWHFDRDKDERLFTELLPQPDLSLSDRIRTMALALAREKSSTAIMQNIVRENVSYIVLKRLACEASKGPIERLAFPEGSMADILSMTNEAARTILNVIGKVKHLETRMGFEKRGTLMPYLGQYAKQISPANIQEPEPQKMQDKAPKAQEANLATSGELPTSGTKNREEVNLTPSMEEEKQKASTAASRIEDFGEKIGGARKDYYGIFLAGMKNDADTAPFSVLWPAPNYQQLLDHGMAPWKVAMLHSLRDAVDRKPWGRGASFLLKRWQERYQVLHGAAMQLIEDEKGTLDKEGIERYLKEQVENNPEAFRNYMSMENDIPVRAALYEALGHEFSLKEYTVRKFVVRHSEPRRYVWALTQGRTILSEKNFSDRETAVSESIRFIKDVLMPTWKRRNEEKERNRLLEARTGERQRTYTYAIYKKAEKNLYAVYVKLRREHICLKGEFPSYQAVLDYQNAHRGELDKLVDDLRQIPGERQGNNAPRVGEDYRKGQDITPEVFAATFGFRGVEFGNWEEQKKRQADLNQTYDAFLDLAHLLHLPSKAISLNGELALAFGARGSGGKNAAKAHYEPGRAVINLTKMNGAGSLAHEWWHAVDFYFGAMNQKPHTSLVTTAVARWEKAEDVAVRPEIMRGFNALKQTLQSSGMDRRSRNLDVYKSKPYWSTLPELSARAFEAYVKGELKQAGNSNDFLVNFVTPEVWESMRPLKPSDYPYPLADEMSKIAQSYENLFHTIQTRETARGTEMYSAENHQDIAQMEQQAVIVPYEELKAPQQIAIDYGWKEMGLRVLFFKGDPAFHGKFDARTDTIYLNEDSRTSVEWTFWHEAFHSLRKQKPGLYNQLVDVIREAEDFSKEQLDAYRQSIRCPHMSESQTIEDMLADKFSDVRKRAGMVYALYEKNPSVDKRLSDWIHQKINRLKEYFHLDKAVKAGLTDKQVAAFSKGFAKLTMAAQEEARRKLYHGQMQAIG